MAVRGLNGKQIEYREVDVTYSGAGGVTQAVTFLEPFIGKPAVLVVGDEADEVDGAVYSATSITKDGFTITVTGSNYLSQQRKVEFFASEKGIR